MTPARVTPARVTPAGALGATVLRTLGLVATYLLLAAVLATSGSTDALGAGLLFFLLVVVVSAVGGTLDAVRRGPGPAAVVWVLTAVLTGLGLALAAPLTGAPATRSVDDLLGGVSFVAVLVVVPALLGTALGALVRRGRGTADGP